MSVSSSLTNAVDQLIEARRELARLIEPLPMDSLRRDLEKIEDRVSVALVELEED